MLRLLATIILISGCVSTSLKSSGTHIDTANDAFARGDYEVAEKEYQQAVQRAEGAGADWVRAEAAKGRAKIAIVRLRENLPRLSETSGDASLRVGEVNRERENLRSFGGDAELDALLVVVLGEHADRWVGEAEAKSARGELYAAANHARPALLVADIPDAVRARVLELKAQAAAASRARAAAAGDAHPLARQFHLAVAASYVRGDVPDAAPLLARYVRGVDVAVTAPASCTLTELEKELAQSGATRRATVAVTITTCTATQTSSDESETARWTEQVLDRYETVQVPERQCRQECGSVLSGGEDCSTNYNTNPPSLLCTKNTIEKCFEVCENVMVPKQEPRYRDEPREAKRTVTTQTSTASVVGSWVVRRDGKEWIGTIRQAPSSMRVSAPSVGKAEARSEGTFSPPAALLESARKSVRGEIQTELDKVFAMDVARAAAAGKAAAGKIDDEEEAWLLAVMLGGQDIGPVATRYAMSRERVLEVLNSRSNLTDEVARPLPAPTVFANLERKDTEQVTQDDREMLEQGAAPKLWLQLDVSRWSLAEVVEPVTSSGMIENNTGLLVGARGGTRVLGRMRSKPWGPGFADELSFGVALGARTGGPEAPDDALAGFAGTVTGAYAIGVGYRQVGFGALFVGVRASYSAYLIGPMSGSYTAVPLFARAEIPLKIGTLSAELLGFSVSGASQAGLSVHLSTSRSWSTKRLKYLQLRIEQTTVKPEVQNFNSPDGSQVLEDHDLTAVHLMYGVGF